MSRRNQLLLEFSFWNEPVPREGPNIYELRSYQLRVRNTPESLSHRYGCRCVCDWLDSGEKHILAIIPANSGSNISHFSVYQTAVKWFEKYIFTLFTKHNWAFRYQTFVHAVILIQFTFLKCIQSHMLVAPFWPPSREYCFSPLAVWSAHQSHMRPGQALWL